MLIDVVALILVAVGAVRGSRDGIARATLDLLLLLLGIPVAFRLGGALGDLVFPSLAPMYGRILGAVVILAILGTVVGRFASRRLGRSVDLTDRLGGSLLGGIRGWLFAAMAVIVLAGLAASAGASEALAGSRLAAAITDTGSWTLSAFETATGDEQLMRAVAFNRVFPDGPVLSEGYRALPATPPAELEPDPEAGVALTLLVNDERMKAGVPPLTWSTALSDVGTRYATEMATEGFFSHDSRLTGDVGDRLRAAGVGYAGAGENLALGPTVERIHDGLMESPDHRANILHRSHRSIGIGVVRSPIGLMVVQVFSS